MPSCYRNHDGVSSSLIDKWAYVKASGNPRPVSETASTAVINASSHKSEPKTSHSCLFTIGHTLLIPLPQLGENANLVVGNARQESVQHVTGDLWTRHLQFQSHEEDGSGSDIPIGWNF